jgi:hypothetical protein
MVIAAAVAEANGCVLVTDNEHDFVGVKIVSPRDANDAELSIVRPVRTLVVGAARMSSLGSDAKKLRLSRPIAHPEIMGRLLRPSSRRKPGSIVEHAMRPNGSRLSPG